MLQACNNPTDIALVQRRLSGQKKQSAGGAIRTLPTRISTRETRMHLV